MQFDDTRPLRATGSNVPRPDTPPTSRQDRRTVSGECNAGRVSPPEPVRPDSADYAGRERVAVLIETRNRRSGRNRRGNDRLRCGTVRRHADIPPMLGRAFQAMTVGRPRPAALFLPQDLMRRDCTNSVEAPAFPQGPQPAVPADARSAVRASRRRGRCQVRDRAGRRERHWPRAGRRGAGGGNGEEPSRPEARAGQPSRARQVASARERPRPAGAPPGSPSRTAWRASRKASRHALADRWTGTMDPGRRGRPRECRHR